MTDLELPIGEWQLAIYYGAWTTIVTALPPDVRRWLCPADTGFPSSGGLRPRKFWGEAPT